MKALPQEIRKRRKLSCAESLQKYPKVSLETEKKLFFDGHWNPRYSSQKGMFQTFRHN